MTFMRKPGSSCAKLIGAQPMGSRMLPIKAPCCPGLDRCRAGGVISASEPWENASCLSEKHTSVACQEEPDLEDETSASPVPFHPDHLLLLSATDSLLR